MDIITNLLNDHIVNALGWALFHTLWQGLILATIAGVIIYLLRYKSSQIRYLTSVFSLFMIVGLSVYNFIDNYNTDRNSIHLADSEFLNRQSNQETIFIDLGDLSKQKEKQLSFNIALANVRKVSSYFPFIVSFWFVGIIFFLVKFILGYFYTRHLRKSNISKIPANWIDKFDHIKSALHLKKTVQYLESKIIQIPMVIGYFKPVILIPAEMLTGMPSDQIESVIAHELAHIRRNDYIINVLQTIIETLFFFHPAVWYLSYKIKDERENCCDDIAISVHNDSIAYAKALVSIQELSLNKQYSAVAFSGRKKHLLNRIKRMIMKQKSNLPKGSIKTNITDKLIATVIIISGIMALSFTYTATSEDYNLNNSFFEQTKVQEKDIEKIKTETVMDTIHINHEKIDIENNTVIKTFEKKDGKKQKMKFTLKNGKVTELYVDGKKIPEKDYDQYQAEIDKTIDDLKDAKVDIRKAMEEIKNLDIEEIHREVEESMKDFHIDMEKMEVEMAKAMDDIEDIDVNEIMRNVEMNLEQLEDIHIDIDMESIQNEMQEISKHIRENIDMDEIRREMENVRIAIDENIDKEELKRQMHKAQEEISKIDIEEIKRQVEMNLQEFETYDKQKTIEELEDKLQELENLELEETK